MTLRIQDDELAADMAQLARDNGRSINNEYVEAFKLYRAIYMAASSGYGRSLVLEKIQRSGYTKAEIEAMWDRHLGGEGKDDEAK